MIESFIGLQMASATSLDPEQVRQIVRADLNSNSDGIPERSLESVIYNFEQKSADEFS